MSPFAAMETGSRTLISNKRKRPPSSSSTPLFNFFSRSKSWRSIIAFTASSGEESSLRTIKLLCSRRVFSPDPESEELRRSIPDSSCEHQIMQKQSESTSANQGSCGFSDADCSSAIPNHVVDVDESIEENVQTTPPEAVVSVGANPSQVADRVSVEPIKSIQGMSPRFCGRLAKLPGLFSYRRLLPYMMDIAKEDDDSATSTNACQKQKNQGTVGEKLLQDGDIPTAESCRDSPKEAIVVVPSHVNGGTSSNDLSLCSVINRNCGDQSSDGQDLKVMEKGVVEGEGKIDHCLEGNGKAPKNKPVDELRVLLHSLDSNDNNNVERSKPCQREVETPDGTKEHSEVSGVSIAERNRLQSVLHNAIGVSGRSSSGSMNKVKRRSILDESDKSPPKSKKMLNQCSRLKLSKSANNSFSYKRLLPYLMEIANDDSGASESPIAESPTEEVKMHSPPPEFEEPSSQTFILLDQQQSIHNNASSVSPISSSIPVENRGLVLEAVTTTSPDGRLESAKEYEKLKREVDPISPVTLTTPLIAAAPAEKEAVVVPPDRLILHESERESTRQVGERGRGILKQNPRGCRGLCTCLSCSSFRLNAERAFDFSRNQMKDTEEVAFTLMKQLSHLRSVLHKFNTLSNVQVKEACLRASEAEEAAKDCLSLMNEDLNIHCRVRCLHLPSVTFNEP